MSIRVYLKILHLLRFQKRDDLGKSLSRLLAISERYPDLKAKHIISRSDGAIRGAEKSYLCC